MGRIPFWILPALHLRQGYGRPLGGDSFMNRNGSNLERQAVFKSCRPDHLGKIQAFCEEEEEADTSSFAALKVSLRQHRVKKNLWASGVWVSGIEGATCCGCGIPMALKHRRDDDGPTVRFGYPGAESGDTAWEQNISTKATKCSRDPFFQPPALCFFSTAT